MVYGSPNGQGCRRRSAAGPHPRGGPPRSTAWPIRRRRRDEAAPVRGRWVAAILGVLVLFAGGVLLFLLLSGRPAARHRPGRPAWSSRCPRSSAFRLADARQNAQAQGFVLSVGAYQVTDQAPEGSGHRPGSGGRSECPQGQRGQRSPSPRRSRPCPVPDLRLRTEADAFDILAQNNLAPGRAVRGVRPGGARNLVIRTNPRAGVNVARGTPIDYVDLARPRPDTDTYAVPQRRLPPATHRPRRLRRQTQAPPPPTSAPTPAADANSNAHTCRQHLRPRRCRRRSPSATIRRAAPLSEAKTQIADAGLQLGFFFPS